MEEWQEWQIRADQIAAQLGADVDRLEADFFGNPDIRLNFRAFWPRFRDLKERVRIAPAIRLEDKLALERRLRPIGSRAYKVQEAVLASSRDRRDELLEKIAGLRATAERESTPRILRGMRRDFDAVRQSFDAGVSLLPADRQAVWEAWREANQYAWQRLQELWAANEVALRDVLSEARQYLEKGNAAAARQTATKFFDALKSAECKQESIAELKAEVDAIRRDADALEERRAAERMPMAKISAVPALDTWKIDLARNSETLSRLRDEVSRIEAQVQASNSLLEQAMIRGTLVEKRRKLSELQRATRTLEQKLAAAEEAPALSAG